MERRERRTGRKFYPKTVQIVKYNAHLLADEYDVTLRDFVYSFIMQELERVKTLQVKVTRCL